MTPINVEAAVFYGACAGGFVAGIAFGVAVEAINWWLERGAR